MHLIAEPESRRASGAPDPVALPCSLVPGSDHAHRDRDPGKPCVRGSVLPVGLSWPWLLFPPLVHGTLNGNPAIVAVALLLAGAGPIGVLLRPQIGYALVGERRWLALTVSAVLGIALIAVLPLQTFLADLPAIAARYGIESGGCSTGGTPIA